MRRLSVPLTARRGSQSKEPRAMMRRRLAVLLAAAVLLWFGSTPVVPQTPTPGIQGGGDSLVPGTVGNCVKYITTVSGGDSGAPCGGGSGTVTSVNASGGTTGLTFSGGPIIASGTLTAGGVLVGANGGTGVANTGKTITLGASVSLVNDPGGITGALASNGTGTFSQAACANLSNGATGCSTTVGTAATAATGTSGHTLGFLDGVNTWSGVSNTFSGFLSVGAPTGSPSAGDVNISGDFKINGTPIVTSAGTVILNTSSLIETLPNAASVGTADNKLVIFASGTSTVRTALTSSTSNTIGICVPGISGTSCGTTGNASIAIAGQANCVFDGATTAGNFVTASTGTAGDCHDAGSSVPTAVFVIGQVLSTNGGAGTYPVDISPIGAMAALNSKAKPGGSSGQIQYNNNNAFDGVTLAIPLSVGWIPTINPNGVGIAVINQASTVSAIIGNVEIATGGTSTVSVFKASSGTACGSGTILHSGSFNANGTAATNQTLTLVGGATDDLAAGDRLCITTTGTTGWTAGTGVGTITVFVGPKL